MTLSIIIPMYNVASYLEGCIKSIGVKNIEYEILMINDGSTDESLRIAESLKPVNSGIKVISQENRGLGGARNTGLAHARGKFIMFLDADDILCMEHFEFLQYTNSEIIQFASQNITPVGRVIQHYSPPETDGIPGKEFWFDFAVMPSACNKIYLKSFLDTHSLRFKEHLYSEDIEFNARAFFLASKVSSKNIVIQKFVQSAGSITRNKSIENKKKLYNDLASIVEFLVKYKMAKAKSPIDYRYFDKIISDIALGAVNFGIKNNIHRTEIYQLKNYVLNHQIPIYSMNYDNPRKNVFKWALWFPFSIDLLKFLTKK